MNDFQQKTQSPWGISNILQTYVLKNLMYLTILRNIKRKQFRRISSCQNQSMTWKWDIKVKLAILFKKTKKDPTITRLTTEQSYLKTLCKRGEITESEKKAMWPKFAQIARAHGLPKTHKPFEPLPKFRSIIDNTNTPYYCISKFLSNLLNPLTGNQYVVKDSFTAANMIREIPKELYDQGYRFVSFDVESLFTSVPLSKAINIILDWIYNKKMLKTNINKRTMKKLLKDCWTKNAFSFNNTIYEQIDGVSMGSCLGPVLANITMTELETVIVDKLFAANLLKFCIRYIDDTLALIKDQILT